MKRKLLSLLLFALPFLLFSQQTINGSITHGGIQRDYILYVPASYSAGTPAPLVFNFHGYTSNAFQQMFYGDFRPIANTEGFLVVHPDGTVDGAGNTHWNVGWGGSTVDDVDFTDKLIDSLAASYSIDLNRVYSTGMSNGGFMSYKLACELSHRFAAIASVTGTMNIGQPNSCNPSHPMPVMEIHGTNDQTVPYNGDTWIESTPDVVDWWAAFNNCNPTPTITPMPDIATGDGSTVEWQVYANGTNGATVEHFKVINGGHTWPGASFPLSGTNYDIDASEEIWRFFSQFDLNGVISGRDAEVENSGLKVWPNPANNRIHFQAGAPGTYELFSASGKLLRSGEYGPGRTAVDITGVPAGIYVIKSGVGIARFVKVK